MYRVKPKKIKKGKRKKERRQYNRFIRYSKIHLSIRSMLSVCDYGFDGCKLEIKLDAYCFPCRFFFLCLFFSLPFFFSDIELFTFR